MSLLGRAAHAKQDGAVATYTDNGLTATERAARDVDRLLETVERIYHVRDLDTLLENILLEARRFVRADAGTVYLVAKGRLFFRYVQNDTLFQHETPEQHHLTASQSLPVDRKSLAGYVASSGEPLLIDDVYDIQSGVDYSHNPKFDQETKYRTRSMLIVPLLTRTGEVVGVLQLINAMTPSGEVIPFSGKDRLYIMQFAQHAATAIERAKLNQEMVLRMVDISRLRDPFETAQHARRVAATSSELYSVWARQHGVARSVMRATRDALVPAAMLHDVGKIAISDAILNKTTDLTEEEIRQIKLHTIQGARLFTMRDSAWDRVARDVALNHHEHWDGSGYPGHIEDLSVDPVELGPGKSGTEIPLVARVVGIADVYDALISERSYKIPWSDDDARAFLEARAGTQFDPELVELFLDMRPVVDSIRDRFDY